MQRGARHIGGRAWPIAAQGALVLLVFACGTTLAAAPRDPVRILFDLDKQGSPNVLKEVRAQHSRLTSGRPADARVAYAFGLILARHGKYSEATPYLRSWVARHPADWQARGALTWTELQARQYDEFVQDALNLSELFGDPARANAPDRLEVARQLGVQLKYLELVKPQAISPQTRMSLRNRILKKHDKAFEAAFNEGGQAVAETLAQMQDQRTLLVERKQEAVRDRVEKARNTIAEEQNRLEIASQRIESGSETLVDAERKLAVLDHQISALMWDQNQLGARMVVVQAQFAELAKSLDLGWVSGSRNDPFQTTRTNRLSPWDPRSLELAGLVNSMTTLRRQSLALERQMLGLQAQAADIRRQGAQSADKIARADNAAADAQRRAARLRKQIDAQQTANKPRPAAVTGRMALLSTYLPSPYDAEKNRLLAELAK